MLLTSTFTVGQKVALQLSYDYGQTIYVIIKEVHSIVRTKFLDKIVVEEISRSHFLGLSEDIKYSSITRTFSAEELIGVEIEQGQSSS